MVKRLRSALAAAAVAAVLAAVPHAPAAGDPEPGAVSEADAGSTGTPLVQEPRRVPETSWKPTVELTANGTEMVVSHVPLEIRDVPVKLWAPSFEGSTAIPGERYTILPMLGLNVLFSKPRLKLGKARVRAGLRWMFFPFAWSGETNVRSFDAATTPDGQRYGTLTTCYAIAPRGIFPGWAWRDPLWTATYGNEESGPGIGLLYFLLNFTPCIQAEAPLTASGKLKLQASLSYYRLEAMSGWLMASDPSGDAPAPSYVDSSEDEDYSETYRRDTLAHCYPLTVGIQYRAVTVGARCLMLTPTEMGRRSGLVPRRLTGYVSVSY